MRKQMILRIATILAVVAELVLTTAVQAKESAPVPQPNTPAAIHTFHWSQVLPTYLAIQWSMISPHAAISVNPHLWQIFSGWTANYPTANLRGPDKVIFPEEPRKACGGENGCISHDTP